MIAMNDEELAESYILWLKDQLKDEHSSTKSHDGLVAIMFETEFKWSIAMDDNRVADAMELRSEFAREHHIRRRKSFEKMWPCSFLEVLLGLSRRLAFVAGGSAPGWAWHLVGNLELARMADPLTRGKEARIRDILTVVIERKYQPDGTGGFFPLSWPDGDQTQIELWYQLNAYVSELHPEHR